MTAVDTLRRLWKAKMRPSLLAAAAGLAWFAVPGTTSTMTISAPPAAVDSFPTYDFTVLLESTSETSANVSAGDVNGDGYLDLVLAKGRHWPLVDRVLLGDGEGALPHALRPRHRVGSLVFRQARGSRPRRRPRRRHKQRRTRSEARLPERRQGTLSRRLDASARPNGRRATRRWRMSMATVSRTSSSRIAATVKASNYICLNRGAGRFDDRCIPFSSEPATTITAADFDRDGLIDLAVPYRDNGQSRIYLAGRHATYLSREGDLLRPRQCFNSNDRSRRPGRRWPARPHRDR